MAQNTSIKRLIAKGGAPGALAEIAAGPEMSPEDFVTACKRLVPKSLATLARIMDDEATSSSARAAAAVTIIERAYGKAAQQINTTHVDLTALHLEALKHASAPVVDVTPTLQVSDKSNDPT